MHELTQKKNKHIDEAVIKKLLETFHLVSAEKVLEGNRNTLKRFGIATQELATISESNYGDLILEKVALDDVMK